MINNEEYKAGLLVILEKIRSHAPSFPVALLDSIEGLIRHREFRIAVEHLCDNICEVNLELPKELKREIVIFAQRLGVDKGWWGPLE